ncbi:MAG: amidohydrolase family protein [Thaumarchaeota archaeon]|nr:amidohydrolase family protein [Nitrososphaerota archaeon]
MSEGFHKNRLSLERIAEVSSLNAARCFGLYPRKGVISIGSDADILVVDPDKENYCFP